ncbi:MAG: VWA domain-containing protein [Vampirovibrionales bacterium]|nr:VWA domain-containing protein [Vampirovibrionales bacterium]
MKRSWISAKGIGSGQVLMIGVMLTGMMFSSLAVDLPFYFATQNQLQTAVNAAALAGASQLPDGEAQAQQAAYEYASQNPVAGRTLAESDLSYHYDGSAFEVEARMQAPTLLSRLMCGLSGTLSQGGGGLDGGGSGGESVGGGGEGDGSGPAVDCSSMTIAAHAKAVPAARDVVLVLDTSGSMNRGNGYPMEDVKDAAVAYVDKVIALDSESVDRIGVVNFDFDSRIAASLTSTYDSNGYATVKSAINNLYAYSGSEWWNTNYYSGLKKALDELESHGRKNATKFVIFLTDGFPNIPDGPDWNYKDCINADDAGDNYMKQYNYYRSRGQISTANYYYTKAQQKYAYSLSCTQGYTDYMINVTQAQAQRAEGMDVTVSTIQIGPVSDNSLSKLRKMLRQPTWEAGLLDYIADTTDGKQYAATNYDMDALREIYDTIAHDVHMRLAS